MGDGGQPTPERGPKALARGVRAMVSSSAGGNTVDALLTAMPLQ